MNLRVRSVQLVLSAMAGSSEATESEVNTPSLPPSLARVGAGTNHEP